MGLTQLSPVLLVQRASYSCLVLPKCLPSVVKNHLPLQGLRRCVPSATTLNAQKTYPTSPQQSRTFASSARSGQEAELPNTLKNNPEEIDVIQLASKQRKRYKSVYVWGFTYTGALGVPSYFFPSKHRNDIRKPKKFQSTPYKLKFDEKVRL